VICGATTSFSPFAVMQAVDPVGGLTELPVTGRTSTDGLALAPLAVMLGLGVTAVVGFAMTARRRRIGSTNPRRNNSRTT
jgi:hypothetical protein